MPKNRSSKPVHTPTPQGHGLGAHRSRHDPRDHVAALPLPQQAVKLPPRVDLTPHLWGIYDQGNLGSCTANAMCSQYRLKLALAGKADFAPSRLALYWGERAREGQTAQDAGAYPRDGYAVMLHTGLAPEADWPYDVAQFAAAPPPQAATDAAGREIAGYAQIPRSLVAMRAELAANEPFTLGIDVYAGFESAQANSTGVIPMPGRGEPLLGGHDILVLGYDDAKKVFKFANSWSDGWGDKGCGYLPYAYAGSTTLAFDRWRMALPT